MNILADLLQIGFGLIFLIGILLVLLVGVVVALIMTKNNKGLIPLGVHLNSVLNGYVIYKNQEVSAASIPEDQRKDNYDHVVTHFRCWEDGPAWTPSLAKALHFSRHEDAASFANEDPEDVRISPAYDFCETTK